MCQGSGIFLNVASISVVVQSQSCLTIWDPMDCSTPYFPVLHYLLLFAHTCVHRFSDATQPYHPVCPFSTCPQSFPAPGYFTVSRLFASGGQSVGASASTSVLPMNNQDWFPLGLTGLISVLSRELSRIFSNTTVPKHQFFIVHPSLWFNSHIHA